MDIQFQLHQLILDRLMSITEECHALKHELSTYKKENSRLLGALAECDEDVLDNFKRDIVVLRKENEALKYEVAALKESAKIREELAQPKDNKGRHVIWGHVVGRKDEKREGGARADKDDVVEIVKKRANPF